SSTSDLVETARAFIYDGLAIEPILVRGEGEMAKLLFHHQSRIIPYTTKRFMKQLCEIQFFEYESLRKQVTKITGKKQLVPLPLTFQTVLFPLRIASTGQVNTRNFLWVRHRYIHRIKVDATHVQHSELVLTDGTHYTVPYRCEFIKQQIRDAYLLEYFFQEAHRDSYSTPHRPTKIDQAHLGVWQDPFSKVAEVLTNEPYEKA